MNVGRKNENKDYFSNDEWIIMNDEFCKNLIVSYLI